MQFKFDPNQEYQLQAIEAVAQLFDGQPRIEADLRWAAGGGFSAIGNRLDLSITSLLANLHVVQQGGGIDPDADIKLITEKIPTADGDAEVSFPNFSVEMETGTGKTYVYIRTALELFRRYGFRKFIVVVPSVAVREGVLKSLQMTGQHLREQYGNLPYRYDAYKSESLSQVRQFALSDSVEFMVMTIDSFNKELNVIRQSTDRLQGETPIHMVQAARPILILDEPQNMESEKSVAALAALMPLFALRYSATHRNPYNLVYRLTPYDAYRQGLVKRIEVASVVQTDDDNRPFIRLDSVQTAKNTLTATLTVRKLTAKGAVRDAAVKVRPGDNLKDKTNREEYAPFDVDTIDAAEQTVLFSNDLELKAGQAVGLDRDAIFKSQILYTVEEHIRKQKKLKPFGIKVLSLFFIDRVDNYRDDGIIKKLFDEAFETMKARLPDWKNKSAEEVQAAYFAERRTKQGAVILEDSSTGRAKKDEAAYDLIMKDKERLLSFDEPVCFVFSHSALREGWDNPNVCQICTLNQTLSEMKKRQEVGRGVRLVVSQAGERERDEKLNVLTVIANESYEQYVARLQSEIEAEYGPDGVPPKPGNARKKKSARLNKKRCLSPEFKALWEKIKHKTRYAVTIDTEKLLDEVVPKVDALEVKPPRVTVTRAAVDVGDDGEGFQAHQMTAERVMDYTRNKEPLPNLIDVIANLLEHTSPPVRLTRRTLMEIVERTSNKRAAIINPHAFATETARILKEKLAEQLVSGIQYERINEWYEMTQFQAEIESWADYLVPAPRGSVYDHVEFESEVERQFVKDLERRTDVRVYVKLPSWFTVQTPVGEYNPDWALVMDDPDDPGGESGKPLLYLVRETKGDNWRNGLRPDESRKILCGERHFRDALGVDYRVVTQAGELP